MLFVGGLATEFCVRATVLDALKNGFRVFLFTDAIKGINKGDVQQAMNIMLKAGAKETTINEFIEKKERND